MFFYRNAEWNEPEVIAEDEFKEIFGEEWEGGEFVGKHCVIDPYYQDIDGINVPLIDDTLEALSKAYYLSCEEI